MSKMILLMSVYGLMPMFGFIGALLVGIPFMVPASEVHGWFELAMVIGIGYVGVIIIAMCAWAFAHAPRELNRDAIVAAAVIVALVTGLDLVFMQTPNAALPGWQVDFLMWFWAFCIVIREFKATHRAQEIG